MVKHRFLVCFGTRPEAIKLFPLIRELKGCQSVKVIVCVTGQHREMLDQVLELIGLQPDLDLDVMQPAQSLEGLTATLLTELSRTIDHCNPTRVVVQGDTATAMAAALAAYYRKIPVAHVEAGLRSGDILSPWPEEVNRRFVSCIADLHFAPTQRAAEALRREGIPESRLFVTGNTVVDALLDIRDRLLKHRSAFSHYLEGLPSRTRMILATCHRRENFGDGVIGIASAFRRVAEREDVQLVLSLHPNPNAGDVFRRELSGRSNISLVEPLSYMDFVAALLKTTLVLTDSGGVQEEAPTFGKPVLVLRDTTERPEAIAAGTAKLVGTDENEIVRQTFRLLDDAEHYQCMSRAHNPFGDGKASVRICRALLDTGNARPSV